MLKRRVVAGALVALLGLGGLSVAARSGGDSPPRAAQEAEMLRRINLFRERQGLRAVWQDDDLTYALRKHSRQMRDRDVLFHTDGESISDELDNVAGVNGWDWAGEIIGHGPTVRGIFRAFRESPPHRSIMLTARANTGACGVAESADGSIWVTCWFYDAAR